VDFSRTTFTDVEDRRPSAVPLDALLALSSDGFLFVASDAHVVSWSASAGAITGIAAERALDSDVRALFKGGEKIVGVPFDGSAYDVRIGVDALAGVHWLRASVVAVNIDAATHGWVCSFGPERHYREIEQLKNEIVAAVSHELKTPIASIKAYATTLRENPATPAAQRDEFLRVIDEQADRLTRAVDDLLLASRVDVEQLLKRRVRVALDEILDDALASLSFDQNTHPLERKTGGIAISGDPDLLREIFVHVLDNAQKFSPPGSPIRVDAESDDRESVISVRDRGIGIAEEHAPYVFERFYRIERELTAQTGGSGLGLFIVKSLVRAHGGSISLTSQPGAGTTFTIVLPVRAA
jgi:signal transduction histidine kinase